MIPSHPLSGNQIRCPRHISHECEHFSRYTKCHGWMFGAWNVASLELCRRAYVNGQYAWPASQGIEVSNLWKVSKILVLIGILLCFYTKNRRYPLMWIPSLWPSPPQLRQVRTTFRAATYPGCDSNDTGEGPRGLVELDHPRLPERSQRYNAELTEIIMTFSDAFKAFKTLTLNAQASMLKDLTPVRGEVGKVSKNASSYELFLSHGNSLLRKVMEALETQPSQDDATIWFHSMKPLTLTTKTRYKPVKKHGKPCRNDLLYKSNTEPGVGCLRVAATC